MRLLLMEAGVEALHRPITGEGAFHDLIRRLQGQIVGNMLLISEPDYEELKSYAAGSRDLEAHERARLILEGAVVS
jgi:hypothetical protein